MKYLTCLFLLVGQWLWAADVESMFQYDAAKDLDVKVISKQTIDGSELMEITYASPVRGRVPAYLVKPAGKGPFAGIVFQHWGQGEKTEFISEALILARAGAISLSVDAPFVRPAEWKKSGGIQNPQEDLDSMVQSVVEWRRGFDLLIKEGADPNRLAFVGHSYGATLGGLLAGMESRVRYVVLMGGLPAMSGGWDDIRFPPMADYVKSIPADQLKKYIATIEPIDSVRFIGRSEAAFLFQFAHYDVYISKAAAETYIKAASEKKEVRWYQTSHDFNDPSALQDRLSWLKKSLQLKSGSTADGSPPVIHDTEIEFANLMQTVADGWNEGNARKAADCFAENAVYVEPPDRQIYRGRDALFKFFGGDEGRKEPMKMTWHHLAFNSETGVGSGEFTFEYGTFSHGVVMVRIQNGKIQNWREYYSETKLPWEEFIKNNPF